MKTIGIILRLEKLDEQYKWFINEHYVLALQQYHVALFPICSYASLQVATTICDGLIIPGGYDLHPFYMHDTWEIHIQCYNKPMDYFDFACIEAFVHVKKPILGICRGMQVLNVYFHGTLKPHIDTTKHEYEHMHGIKCCDPSFLRALYPQQITVNSFHHQVVDQIGQDMMVSATTLQDDIEAIEHKELPIIAVQWHPERMEDDQILPYFISLL